MSGCVVALREGKNREVKNVLGALGLKVNRLIRVSFGPFQLSDLPIGAVEVVKARVLREQLGKRLADEAGVDFDSEHARARRHRSSRAAPPIRALRAAAPGSRAGQAAQGHGRSHRALPLHRPRRRARASAAGRAAPRRPRRAASARASRAAAAPAPRATRSRARRARSTSTTAARAVFEAKTYGKKPQAPARCSAAGDTPSTASRASFGDTPEARLRRPPRRWRDRPKRAVRDKPTDSAIARSARRRRGREAPTSARPTGRVGTRRVRDARLGTRPRADGADASEARLRRQRRRADLARSPQASVRRRVRAADGAERPKRAYGAARRAPRDRPKRACGDKPRGPRPTVRRQARAARARAGDKPFAKRPRGSGPAAIVRAGRVRRNA